MSQTVSDQKKPDFTIFVTHTYGTMKDGSLPPATECVLYEVHKAARDYGVVHNFMIIIASWAKQPQSIQEREQEQKMNLLNGVFMTCMERYVKINPLVDNSVSEIREACGAIKNMVSRGYIPKVCVIAAHFHFGLKYLWNRHLREQGLSHIPISFRFVGVKNMWGLWMPSPFQQSTLRWILTGIVRTYLYIRFGMGAESKANHPYTVKE